MMNNKVMHFEIPCDDPEKMRVFFQQVFGWEFQQLGNEQYWFARTGADDAPGINGALMKKRDPRQPVVNTIVVENVDEYAKKIEQAGGKIAMPKWAIAGMGWVAYFLDPDGNMHGIWQTDPQAK